MSETETLRHRLEQRLWQTKLTVVNDAWSRELHQECLQRITDLEAQVSALTAQVEQLKTCVCHVDDGLVQEWVSKARAVAKSKGFVVAPPGDPVSPAPHQERE